MSRNWQLAVPTPEAYWIGRVLFDVQHKPADMERFRRDPDAYLADVPLSPERKADIRDHHFGRLYLAGANPYLLRAHCLAMGVSEGEFLGQLRAVLKESSGG